MTTYQFKQLLKAIRTFIVFPVLGSGFLFFGCYHDNNGDNITPKAEIVEGCTDIAGLNYSRDANKNDGDCRYDYQSYLIMTLHDQGVESHKREVTALIRVMDEEDRGISGLFVDNFRIAENGRLIGTEAKAELKTQAIPFSIYTVLLLDLSSSVEGLVPEIKLAAISLISEKMPNQKFSIHIFNSKSTLIQDFTDDTNLLIKAINSLPESGLLNSTNIYGAIANVADTWEDESSIDRIIEGSIVLFTDGFHNANSLTVNDALIALRTNNESTRKVYVAALNSPDLSRVSLQQLTGHVAVGFFEAANISELSNTFVSIQDEIENLSNSRYLLKYQSPITDPISNNESLEIAILGNSNLESDGRILTSFNSKGFKD